MKTTKIMLAVITGMTGVILSSCQTKEQKLENAQENAATANENAASANEDLSKAQREYREEQESGLRDNDMSIETYRANIKERKESEREEYRKKVDSLEQKNKELRAKLNAYSDKGDNTKWESFKREFNHDAGELKKSLKDLTKNNVK